MLAIEQLSESSDNKERYRILGQLGASKPMVNRSLLVQIGITFMFPLIVALIHSFVALKEINYIIQCQKVLAHLCLHKGGKMTLGHAHNMSKKK